MTASEVKQTPGAATATTASSKPTNTPAELTPAQEKRLKLQRRQKALKEKEGQPDPLKGMMMSSTTPPQKRKRDDDGDAAEKGIKRGVTEAAGAEMKQKRPVAPKKSAKRETKEGAAATMEGKTTTPVATKTKQKRKRDDDGEAAEKDINRAVTEAAGAEMKKKRPVAPKKGAKRETKEGAAATMEKKTTTPVATNTKQKRKRDTDDEGGEKTAKRGLTGVGAVGIAQQTDHTYSQNLENMNERRDSVVEAGAGDTDVDAPGDVLEGDGQNGQHLAPPTAATGLKEVPNDLTVHEDEDEMTRMLKEELAKPYVEDDEPEDPRVEEIMKPLTEHEKRQIANHPVTKKGLITLEQLQKAVQIALVAHKKRAAMAARKKTSLLASDGVAADEQEIEGRPKLAPKSRMPAPTAAKPSAGVPAAIASSATSPSEEQQIEQRPKAVAKTRQPAPKAATMAPRVSVDDALTPTEAEEQEIDPPSPQASKSSAPAPKAPATIAAAPPASYTYPAPAPPAYDAATAQPAKNFTKLTVNELKALCRERGLMTGGNKPVLIQRLKDFGAERAAGGAVGMGVQGQGQGQGQKGRYVWMG